MWGIPLPGRIIVSNGRVSEEKYYISGSPAAIIVYVQLPPRSWSTIKSGCHYSPQSLSTAAIRIHHQLPPRSWSTTIIRCQHNKGSAIIMAVPAWMRPRSRSACEHSGPGWFRFCIFADVKILMTDDDAGMSNVKLSIITKLPYYYLILSS